MKFTGTITSIGAVASGTSKSGKAWRRIDVVMEYEHGQYPKSILFSVMNDNIEKFALQERGEYEVEVDFSVREYQGKHYMSASCWKATGLNYGHKQPDPYMSATTTQPGEQIQTASDDLPF